MKKNNSQQNSEDLNFIIDLLVGQIKRGHYQEYFSEFQKEVLNLDLSQRVATRERK